MRPSEPRAGSQAGSNGPSGSPPLDSDRDPDGFQRYARGSTDNMNGLTPAAPDDEHYMRGWFAREHGKAWGDARHLTPAVERAVAKALKRWNDWRREHGLPAETRLPL